MERIFISQILSDDLKSRSSVHTLYVALKSKYINELVFDFSNVNFASRSFIDEFYNVFIKEHRPKLENVPDKIAVILDAVSRTQEENKKTITKKSKIKSFNSVDEFCSYMTSIAF
ncbi:MAG TPA: hypothetical protein PLI69_03600 [Bacteroidales bacterium]|nr:hypothetical protein [Bacteroidales bacterium]